MIHIICGTCGTSKGYKTAADGEFSLPAAEEARLVKRKVAAYAARPITGEPSTPPEPPSERPEQPDVSLDTPAAEDPAPPEDGEEAARLERLPKADLEQMAQDLGLDISGAKNKHDLTVLIASADTDGDEEVPDLEAGGVVQ